MINLQNPSIPIHQNAIEIDRTIIDLQAVLSLSLSWLTQPYGRAYKNLDVTQNKRVYYPQVYLGTQNNSPRYITITPDNDKEGQCFFYVNREVVTEYQAGQHSFLTYDVGIIFSVNLELINSALLDTTIFTANLVADVRDVLTRQNLGTRYRLVINSVDYDFQTVFSGFSVEDSTVLEKAPLQHFKVNCTVVLQEECGIAPSSDCETLLSKLTTEQLNDCILPTYDFSDTVVQDATTGQQQTDMTDWLCTATPNIPTSFLLDGVNESFSTANTALNDWDGKTPFTITCWMRSPNYAKNQGIVSKMEGASIGRGWYFVITATGFGLAKAGTVGDVTARTTAITNTNNTWYHFAFTDDGSGLASGMKLYRDGVLMTSTSSFTAFNTTATNTSDLKIGTFLTAGFLDGNVCYTRVWKKEFSASDIIADYNARNLLNTPLYPADLVAGFTPNQTAIYANGIWNARNEADATNGFGSTNNLEYADLTTDIPT